MTIVIYHNPNCSKSRKVVDLVREAGHTPTLVPYLKEGWTHSHLLGLFAGAGLSPREALRTARGLAQELGLLAETVSDEQILAAMCEHPELVERPFVCSAKGVRLCRPPETVLDLI